MINLKIIIILKNNVNFILYYHLICSIPNCSLILAGNKVCKIPTPPESVQTKTIGSLPILKYRLKKFKPTQIIILKKVKISKPCKIEPGN